MTGKKASIALLLNVFLDMAKIIGSERGPSVRHPPSLPLTLDRSKNYPYLLFGQVSEYLALQDQPI